MIGIDIEQISRIAKLVDRYDRTTLNLLFTHSEIEQCQFAPSHYYALCFSAKEAVGKALGTGLADIGWTEIEVTIAPHILDIQLSGAAYDLAIQQHIHRWYATWWTWDDYVLVQVFASTILHPQNDYVSS
ncbi:holo-ACP synthase [Leptolyngbya sp. AN03gr2]|uniref:holo-ACP synthase n=1 Tax=unclassified Leptolyngbya TaxID=2650499 RepID=UPI003D3132D4